MAYQALYRKYRPKTFSDVVGQEHITNTLKNELSKGKAVHAYLFTGTRGTGKTSCAKILAKAVNCLSPENGDPCLKCESCLSVENGENTDIVEIDAASNNSVDSIRELRDRVAFAPSSSKYRVYIIDEVHMLTISAFNALLKTLEEPPEFVTFILLAHSSDAFLQTILSRCALLSLRPLSDELLEKALREKIKDSDPTALHRAIMLSGGYIGQALELYKKRDDALFERCEKFAAAFVSGKWLEMTDLLTFAGKDARQKFTEYVSALEKYIKRCFGYTVAGSSEGLSENERALTALGTEKLTKLCGAVGTTAENSNINVNLNLWSVYTVKKCREIR